MNLLKDKHVWVTINDVYSRFRILPFGRIPRRGYFSTYEKAHEKFCNLLGFGTIEGQHKRTKKWEILFRAINFT